jgi:hypothetical protein
VVCPGGCRTCSVMAIVGLGLVAISVLGQEPGYGVLSLYVIYCLTLSHSMFFLRVTVMLAVIGCHVAAIRIWNSVRCAACACACVGRHGRCVSSTCSLLLGPTHTPSAVVGEVCRRGQVIFPRSLLCCVPLVVLGLVLVWCNAGSSFSVLPVLLLPFHLLLTTVSCHLLLSFAALCSRYARAV